MREVLDNYVADMEELVGAENRSIKVRADRLDIWYNMKQIESPITQLESTVMITSIGHNSWASFGETDEMKNRRQKEERNHNKLKNIYSNVMTGLVRRLKTNVSGIWDLYNDYIKPFEQLDDTYRSKLNKIYNEQTSDADKRKNAWTGFKNIAGAFIKAFAVVFVAAFAAAVAPAWLVVGAIAVLAGGCS